MVLKKLNFSIFYFWRVWWSCKNGFSAVSTLGGCGVIERIDVSQFLLFKGVVVLKN